MTALSNRCFPSSPCTFSLAPSSKAFLDLWRLRSVASLRLALQRLWGVGRLSWWWILCASSCAMGARSTNSRISVCLYLSHSLSRSSECGVARKLRGWMEWSVCLCLCLCLWLCVCVCSGCPSYGFFLLALCTDRQIERESVCVCVSVCVCWGGGFKFWDRLIFAHIPARLTRFLFGEFCFLLSAFGFPLLAFCFPLSIHVTIGNGSVRFERVQAEPV